jgi:hypothetical protein
MPSSLLPECQRKKMPRHIRYYSIHILKMMSDAQALPLRAQRVCARSATLPSDAASATS